MEKRTISRFLKAIVRGEKHNKKPLLLKCGLALSLTFAGFLYSHFRTKRVKSSTTFPKGHHTSPRSQVNSGEGLRTNYSFSSTISEGNTIEIQEDSCLKRVISNNSLTDHSPIPKQIGDKDDLLLLEFSDHVKKGPAFIHNTTNTGTCPFKNSSVSFEDSEKDEYEQEIKQLRSMIRVLQERERTLEVQLLEYCGFREQEATVMELQNRLKISSMEAKMFNLKMETLQSENRRLQAQLADHGKVVAELDAAKAKVKLLKKKIKYEAEENKEQIMNLKQKVCKMQDVEARAAASDREIEAKLGRLKEVEAEVEELRKCNVRLQMENSELGMRLESTQMLAHAVLEDPEADAQRIESERIRRNNDALAKEIEQLQNERCSDIEELVYLRWINACLRHELRNYRPPPGKTVARDLSRSLSPKSEKKAKQLILQYAHNEMLGNLGYVDLDQWSSAQASLVMESAEIYDYSLVGDAARGSVTNKSKIIGKLMNLFRGKEGGQSQLSRAMSLREKSKSIDDNHSPRLSSLSSGNDAGGNGSKSEQYLTPPSTTTTSLDLGTTSSLKEEDTRAGSSKSFSPRNRVSTDSRSHVESFPDSPSSDKSNLVKYAEALKDSSGIAKLVIHRRSSTFSSF